MKITTTKKLLAFIIMVFSVTLANAQCSCYCSSQPKNNAICVFNPDNGNSHCKHVGPRYCGRIGEVTSAADETFLEDVYPNPVSTSANIAFYVEHTQNVSLKVYDVSGRFVTTLVDASFEEGEHEITWNAADVKSGIYLLRMQALSYSENWKLIVTK